MSLKQAQLEQIKLPKLQEMQRMIDILNEHKLKLEQQLEEYVTVGSVKCISDVTRNG